MEQLFLGKWERTFKLEFGVGVFQINETVHP